MTEAITTTARIFKQSVGARNRVGTGLSYRPARLQIHRLAELTFGIDSWAPKSLKFGLCSV